jgi:hypothetical protein
VTVTSAAPQARETGPAGRPAPVFRLATHKAFFLARTSVPLLVADQNLRERKTLPKALGPWALDSGGFMQLKKTGRWQFTAREYVQRIARYQAGIGNLAWASPMDYMNEAEIQLATGMNTAHHQMLTLQNYIELITWWHMDIGGPCPIIPVLQGWTIREYLWHHEMYESAGIDLASFPVVGLGTVCRRQNTIRVGILVRELADRGLRLHGFGVKTEGLEDFGHLLASADSASWSYDAYRLGKPLFGHTHQTCSNCLDYALMWRRNLLGKLGWDDTAGSAA